MDTTFALIHSPLVGPLTWQPVADQLRQRGLAVVVPTIREREAGDAPYWWRHAESVAAALATIPAARPLALVGHSGAGPLLPLIRQRTPHPAAAYLFVDAGLPHGGRSRLTEMEQDAPAFAVHFRQHLISGGRYPAWSDADLRPVIPDDQRRRGVVAELRPRGLDFFTEPFPHLTGWPDAPCAYVQFTASYGASVAHAERAGWPMRAFDAGHFHMLVDPAAVADTLVTLHREMGQPGGSSAGSMTMPS